MGIRQTRKAPIVTSRLCLLGDSGDKEKEMRRKIDRRLKKSDWYDFLKKRINVINKSYRLEVNRVYRSVGSVLPKKPYRKA